VHGRGFRRIHGLSISGAWYERLQPNPQLAGQLSVTWLNQDASAEAWGASLCN
jgi:hypothetical protein